LQAGRNAAAEFEAGPRIPTAGFFDVDGVRDPQTSLPHMLPTPAAMQAGACHL